MELNKEVAMHSQTKMKILITIKSMTRLSNRIFSQVIMPVTLPRLLNMIIRSVRDRPVLITLGSQEKRAMRQVN